MKLFDRVRVISDAYEKVGIKKGDEGHILEPEIRYGTFCFVREDPETLADEEYASVKIEDLELVKDGGATDETILECLPGNNPEWGCKVIDGFIYNLKGERMNEYAYDYYHRRKR